MTRFRPCIDLHDGVVKQIVGGTLDAADQSLRTNHVSTSPAEAFARRYREDQATGGHVIMLGPGNEAAAEAALRAWPGGLQVGGGISAATAHRWLAAGASKVIVTSWLFPDRRYSPERSAALQRAVGRDHLVYDLSCRRGEDGWWIAMDRWQTRTEHAIDARFLAELATGCSEFLVHAADVEGLCRGIDEELVASLGRWSPIPCTYAGGGRSIDDLATIDRLSGGALDMTFGSALDIFGGHQVRYEDCIAWNRRQRTSGATPDQPSLV